MIDDVAGPRADAGWRASAAAATLDDLRALDTELLGKRGALGTAQAAPRRRSTAADRPAAGQAAQRRRWPSSSDAARGSAAPSSPPTTVAPGSAAERLDLTELDAAGRRAATPTS